jgi:predicted O-linked N-acetylglucosamine transferase (SPINDLY family)
MGEDSTRERITQAFATHQIPPAQLDLLAPAHEPADHLRAYHSVDIALDTFPYHGTATTCEALYMGVPVIVLAGQTHAQRVGASLLTAVSLPDMIADSVDQYIAKALQLAQDHERRLELRQRLRSQMQGSILMDEKSYTRRLEHTLRSVWQTWCAAR